MLPFLFPPQRKATISLPMRTSTIQVIPIWHFKVCLELQVPKHLVNTVNAQGFRELTPGPLQLGPTDLPRVYDFLKIMFKCFSQTVGKLCLKIYLKEAD